MVTKELIKTTVKIDGKLLKRLKTLISKQDKKLKYPTTKHFINIAVLNLIKREEK